MQPERHYNYGSEGNGPLLSGLPHARLAISLTLGIAAIGIFLLPLLVPVRATDTISTSYLAGFNNTVAIGTASIISVAVLLFTFRLHANDTPRMLPAAQDRLSPRYIFGVACASAAILSLCGYLVAASHIRYLADAGYIIEQATVRRSTGRALYTQLEFAYGPLLLLPEVWLSHLLHGSMVAAYYATLVFESTAGILLLAYVLNAIPIRGDLRRVALVLFAFGAITPHLGLNYTFLRFVTPYAVLVFATRSRSLWLCAFSLSVGEILVLLLSPELGLALAIGILTFSLLRAWQNGWQWLMSAVIPMSVLAALLSTLGRPYLRMAASFSQGALSLPVGPYPHLLVFLFALVALVPLGLGRFLHLRDPASARLLGFYATGLAFLPAALGRCDPLHILFNGIGILVLSLFAISHSSQTVRRTWMVAVALLVFWNHFVNERLFSWRTTAIVGRTVLPHLPSAVQRTAVKLLAHGDPELAHVLIEPLPPEFYLDMVLMNKLVGPALVVTPLEISPAIEEQLIINGHYCPGYYAFWVDMMNPRAEQRSIAEVNAQRWMLLPSGWRPDGLEPHMPSQAGIFQGYSLPYHQRNSIPYIPGFAFLGNLQTQWATVTSFGPYTLYQRKAL